MNTIPRKSFSILVCGLVLACVILRLFIPSPVQADVGVRPILPGGSNIQPEGQTFIQMADEVVTMTVRSATAADNTILQLNPQAYGFEIQPVWYSAVAEVQAVFTMTNPTTDEVSLIAWFPLASALESVSWEINSFESVPRIASFHVAVDDRAKDYSVIELPNPKGVDKPPLPWASFPVTFPGGTGTVIHVSYLVPLSTAVKGSELALYYIFQTGAGWAGPIGHAKLVLNLPYPASAGTLARISSSSFNIPYVMLNPQNIIPLDGVTNGNQATWTWTDFEPSPQDDFSIWLVDPVNWQKLEDARAEVQAHPQDGYAWLKLASIYHNMSTRSASHPSIFSSSYLSQGIEAYKKAAELLPEHPTPHVGLALLTLVPYVDGKYMPAEVMQFILMELQTARDLEAKYPDLAEQGGLPSRLLDDALSFYYYGITATAEFAASSTAWAKGTEAAALLLTPSVTPTPQPTLTPTVSPSPALEPSPTTQTNPAVSPPVVTTSNGGSLVIILAAAVIGLIIVGYLVLKRK